MGFLSALRRTALTASVLGVGIYTYDRFANNRVLARTGYAYCKAMLIAMDYKLNFEKGKDITALHERNALRLYNLITHNKGLYVKIGQSVAIQGNMLPQPYRVLLANLYDNAPQDTWHQCLQTLETGLQKPVDEVFEYIDPQAVASASIAQVHRAKLKTGEEVAVKIQHADIAHSAHWDLNTYKALMWVFDKVIFKMPMYFMGKYIADQVLQETDFAIEMSNSQNMRNLIQNDKELNQRLYVPKVYPELSSSRVLVMEWIEGKSLSRDKEVQAAGFDIKYALTTVFKALTKETFEWGVVHCDPHPGNWILRHADGNPKNNSVKNQQLVMLDHGLYVFLDSELREQYARLWIAIFRRDMSTISEITQKWGFGDPKMFASATMLQSYDTGGRRSFKDEQQDAERFKNFLKDASKIPLALIFVGRTHRILQGLNQLYDSPVNRMSLLVNEAFRIADAANPMTDVSGPLRLVYTLRNWVLKQILLAFSNTMYGFMRVYNLFRKQNPETNFEESMQKGGMAILRS